MQCGLGVGNLRLRSDSGSGRAPAGVPTEIIDMKLLFPSHPLKSRLPDPDYEAEVSAARRAGFECEFYNLELLRNGDAGGACVVCSPSERPAQGILHRGWMM